MQLPNKLFSYEESIFSKFPIILETLEAKSLSVKTLFLLARENFVIPTDFIETLDALYALGKLRYDEKDGKIVYVNRD